MENYRFRTLPAALPGIVLGVAAMLAAGAGPSAAQGWQPSRPVTFVIPAGTGGGADQMARFIQGMVTKHNLMNQPMVVVNKAGGAGLEGFLDMKATPNDPHKLIITLSNLFTTPLATKTPFNWKELTPVSMLALDQFVLWVNAESPYKTYVPFAGGGAVAVQLVGKHVDSTVNNPIEAVAQWKAGALRPLCIFDGKRSTYTTKVTATMAWSDIPTCKESGVAIEYQMLRGIFMAGGATPDQVAYYVGLFDKVRQTPDWKQFMEQGAFNQTVMTGPQYRQWLEAAEKLHYDLMKEANFLAN